LLLSGTPGHLFFSQGNINKMSEYATQSIMASRLRDDLPALYPMPDGETDLGADLDAINAEVDAYIAQRYALPLVSSSAIRLTASLALSLAVEKAYMRGHGPEVQEKHKRAAKEARDFLKLIAGGGVRLGGEAPAAERQGVGSTIVIDGDAPRFTRPDLEGF